MSVGEAPATPAAAAPRSVEQRLVAPPVIAPPVISPRVVALPVISPRVVALPVAGPVAGPAASRGAASRGAARRLLRLLLATTALLALAPAAASAHARLEGTSPERGATVPKQPAQIAFRFDEPVETALGAVRVFDASAARVDTGPVLRPGGQSSSVGVALRDGLSQGTYTATYRVISADGHVVSGGMTFSVGKAGTRPPAAVEDLLEQRGPSTLVATVRDLADGVGYLALALLAGGLAWLWLCARPALGLRGPGGPAGPPPGDGPHAVAGLSPGDHPDALAGPPPGDDLRVATDQAAAAGALVARARRAGLLTAGAGLLSAVAGLAAEGAGITGRSLLHGLSPSVVGDVAGTRTGTVLVLQAASFAALLLLLALARPRPCTPRNAAVQGRTPLPAQRPRPSTPHIPAVEGRTPGRTASLQSHDPALPGRTPGAATAVLDPARPTTATGAAPTAPPAVPGGRATLAALGLLAAALVVLPAFEGHQASQPQPWGPILDVGHVAAMAVWIGGIAALLLLLPAATRQLAAPADRTRLLAATLQRFSPLALSSVLGLTATGAVAAIFQLDKLSDLTSSATGRLIVLKVALLLGLAGAGAVHRRRLMPALRQAAADELPPGAAGRTTRSVLRAEAGLLIAVLAATSVLVSTTPPGSGQRQAGPLTLRQAIGPLRLQTTVDPAQAGPDAVRLSLFDARTGAPFAGAKELTATAALPGTIDGLPVTLRRAGPGHWVADTLQLAPAGTWRLHVTARVSDFDQYETDVEVKVR